MQLSPAGTAEQVVGSGSLNRGTGIDGSALGNFQSSLRDCSSLEFLPRTASWANSRTARLILQSLDTPAHAGSPFISSPWVRDFPSLTPVPRAPGENYCFTGSPLSSLSSMGPRFSFSSCGWIFARSPTATTIRFSGCTWSCAAFSTSAAVTAVYCVGSVR